MLVSMWPEEDTQTIKDQHLSHTRPVCGCTCVVTAIINGRTVPRPDPSFNRVIPRLWDVTVQTWFGYSMSRLHHCFLISQNVVMTRDGIGKMELQQTKAYK